MTRIHPLPHPKKYRDIYGDLWIDGEAFIGRYRNPAMPPRIAMTDRNDGAIYVLSNDDALDVAVLDDYVPGQYPDVTVYGPYEGPYTDGYRLYIMNEDIFAEPATEGNSNGLVLTRWNFQKVVLQVSVDGTGSVVYSVYQL